MTQERRDPASGERGARNIDPLASTIAPNIIPAKSKNQAPRRSWEGRRAASPQRAGRSGGSTQLPAAVARASKAYRPSAHSREVLPPLYAAESALVEAWPVVLDANQYDRARALGLAGRIGRAQFASVIVKGNRFELAMHREDQRRAEIAFLVPARNVLCELADVVAWFPETGVTATLLGEIGSLGLPALFDSRPRPPIVHESLLDWFRADEPGLFVLDDALAAIELDGVSIATSDREAGLRLRGRLAPHSRRPPRIFYPRNSGRPVA